MLVKLVGGRVVEPVIMMCIPYCSLKIYAPKFVPAGFRVSRVFSIVYRWPPKFSGFHMIGSVALPLTHTLGRRFSYSYWVALVRRARAWRLLDQRFRDQV